MQDGACGTILYDVSFSFFVLFWIKCWIALHAMVQVMGQVGSVVAAAYWLFQTHPASGKHWALQQLFRARPNATNKGCFFFFVFCIHWFMDSHVGAYFFYLIVLSHRLVLMLCFIKIHERKLLCCLYIKLSSETLEGMQSGELLVANSMLLYWATCPWNKSLHQASVQPCPIYYSFLLSPVLSLPWLFYFSDIRARYPPSTASCDSLNSLVCPNKTWVMSWIPSIPCWKVFK